MWNGKLKAVTFSFDDGVLQDVRAIKILDKYGLKGTFNLNSGYFGTYTKNNYATYVKVDAQAVKDIYAGHEVAAHTLTHPYLLDLDENGIIWQVEKDREILSELCGYEVVGLAYPGREFNSDDRVASIVKNNTGIKYARTNTNTYNFDLQENYYRLNPTVPANSPDCFEVAKRFIEAKAEKPQLLYAWGHTYEFDGVYVDWIKFEEFCEFLSNRDDVFYGTNKEVLL